MKGFLSFMVLRFISKKHMSGEELREELKKRKGTKPSAGTIYPVLKSLSEMKFIEEIETKGKMKQYRITAKGKKELKVATKKFCQMFYDLSDELSCACRD